MKSTEVLRILELIKKEMDGGHDFRARYTLKDLTEELRKIGIQ